MEVVGSIGARFLFSIHSWGPGQPAARAIVEAVDKIMCVLQKFELLSCL